MPACANVALPAVCSSLTVTAALLLMALLSTGCSRATPNLSGTWDLNLEKSHWPAQPQIARVQVVVDHRHPAILYAGTVLYTDGSERQFGFDGSVDGKQYPALRSFGVATIAMRRINANSIASVAMSPDRTYVESAVMSMGREGRSLRRDVHLIFPGGSKSWLEIYDRH